MAVGYRFRRTLVGLKQYLVPIEQEVAVRFRRTLVGLKPNAENIAVNPNSVSDGPLWG